MNEPPKAIDWSKLSRKEQDKAIRDELESGKLLMFEARELTRTIGVMNQMYMNEQMLRQRLTDMMYQLDLNNRALQKLNISKDDYGKAIHELEESDRAEYEKQQLGLVPKGSKDLNAQKQGAILGLDGKPVG